MVGLYDGKVHPRQQVQRFIGNIAGVRKEADAAILRVEPPAAGAGGIVEVGIGVTLTPKRRVGQSMVIRRASMSVNR